VACGEVYHRLLPNLFRTQPAQALWQIAYENTAEASTVYRLRHILILAPLVPEPGTLEMMITLQFALGNVHLSHHPRIIHEK